MISESNGPGRVESAGPQADDKHRPDLRPLAVLTVTSAAGVAAVAVAFQGARLSRSWADPVFWASLLIILLPIAVRLLGRGASRSERLVLVLILGLALYVVKVLLSPAGFTLHDELGQYRSVADVLRTGQLYTNNPVVPAYSFYPGVLTVTAALSRLSGLGIFPSGLIVIGVARLLLMGGLFMLIERITRSSRVAGIAVLIYVANPNFVFFDSEFAYESFALGIAAMALWATARVAGEDEGGWGDLTLAGLLVCALVLSHHLTSYAVALVMTAWTALALVRHRSSPATKRLALLNVFTLVATGAYAVYAYHATSSDIGGSLVGSIHGLLNVITGATSGKAPFSAAQGYTDPPLERAAGLISVALLLVALPCGLYAIWRRSRSHPGPGLVILAFAALLYPLSLALRLTAAGSETSNRTSEFLFVGLGTVAALAFVAWLGRYVDRRGARAWGLRLLATACVGLIFVGGITVGTPPYQLLPAGYEVGAGPRSIDAEGVAATHWAARSLPAHANFLADESDSELLAAYTDLIPQSGSAAGAEIGELFVAPAFGGQERGIVTLDKLRYLVTDHRDSTALPRSGQYFDSADPQPSYAHPIPVKALDKFDVTPCIDRIFSSGNVVIYDTYRLLAGCR